MSLRVQGFLSPLSKTKRKRGKKVGKDYLSILMEWKPEGDFTEADLWDAIAEAEGVDVSEISDRDLTEFI
jgi:hypothetical protein